MKAVKFIMGITVIIMMLPIIGIMAILGGGISGLYYLIFMIFYRVLDFVNGKHSKEVLLHSYKI